MYIIKISEEIAMRIASVNNYDKTTFGYFAKPAEDVSAVIKNRMRGASEYDRDEFIQNLQEIVKGNENVKKEVTLNIDESRDKRIYALFNNERNEPVGFYESKYMNQKPLERIISIMRDAAQRAKEVDNLEMNFERYDNVWANSPE